MVWITVFLSGIHAGNPTVLSECAKFGYYGKCVFTHTARYKFQHCSAAAEGVESVCITCIRRTINKRGSINLFS